MTKIYECFKLTANRKELAGQSRLRDMISRDIENDMQSKLNIIDWVYF